MYQGSVVLGVWSTVKVTGERSAGAPVESRTITVSGTVSPAPIVSVALPPLTTTSDGATIRGSVGPEQAADVSTVRSRVDSRDTAARAPGPSAGRSTYKAGAV